MRAHPYNSPYMPPQATADPNFLDRSRGPLTKELLTLNQVLVKNVAVIGGDTSSVKIFKKLLSKNRIS